MPVAQNRVVSALVEPQLAMGALSLAAGSNPAPDDHRRPRGQRDGRRAPAGDHRRRHERRVRRDHDHARLSRDAVRRLRRVGRTDDDRRRPGRGRSRPLPRHPARHAAISRSARPAHFRTRNGWRWRRTRRASACGAPCSTRIPTAAYGLQSTRRLRRQGPAARRELHGRRRRRCSWARTARSRSTIADGWAYGSQPTDASTMPLLVDAAGSVYAATRSYADGREALVLTFSQSPTALHTLGLAYGVVSWVTRGLFIGERHVYLSPQLDDFFLASVIYPVTGTTYRCTAADLQAFASWQNARSGRPGDRAVPGGVRVQRQRRQAGGPGRPDGQGARARADLRLDQPHLGPRGPEPDGVRRRVRGVQQEPPIRPRGPVPLQRREPGHAGHLGARQSGGHARRL